MLKVYYANIGLIKDESIFQELFEKVNIQRREKVLRCKHEKDKLRSLMTGYLLYMAVEKEGLLYDKLEFATEANGKPFLKSYPDVSFSLSHAGEYAVCLISNRSVGIDIETKNKPIFKEVKAEKIETLARKIFSEVEWKQFKNVTKEQEVELFLQIWTRKESYSKADGKGIRMELSTIQTDTKEYFSKWLDEDTCLSIYVEDGSFSDLQIEKVICL